MARVLSLLLLCIFDAILLIKREIRYNIFFLVRFVFFGKCLFFKVLRVERVRELYVIREGEVVES